MLQNHKKKDVQIICLDLWIERTIYDVLTLPFCCILIEEIEEKQTCPAVLFKAQLKAGWSFDFLFFDHGSSCEWSSGFTCNPQFQPNQLSSNKNPPIANAATIHVQESYRPWSTRREPLKKKYTSWSPTR